MSDRILDHYLEALKHCDRWIRSRQALSLSLSLHSTTRMATTTTHRMASALASPRRLNPAAGSIATKESTRRGAARRATDRDANATDLEAVDVSRRWDTRTHARTHASAARARTTD